MSEYFVTIDGVKKNISIIKNEKVKVENKSFDVNLSKVNNYVYLLKVGDKVYEITTNKLGDGKYGFLLDGVYYNAVVRTRLQEIANEYFKRRIVFHITMKLKLQCPDL